MLSKSTYNEKETEDFAFSVASLIRPGDLIACRGGMGAGKTAFARGLARGLGLADAVSSPTFALVNAYTHGRVPMYHFDMYRVTTFDDLYSTGFFDYLDQGAVVYIEWSENIDGALPDRKIYLTIVPKGDHRDIFLEGGPF